MEYTKRKYLVLRVLTYIIFGCITSAQIIFAVSASNFDLNSALAIILTALLFIAVLIILYKRLKRELNKLQTETPVKVKKDNGPTNLRLIPLVILAILQILLLSSVALATVTNMPEVTTAFIIGTLLITTPILILPFLAIRKKNWTYGISSVLFIIIYTAINLVFMVLKLNFFGAFELLLICFIELLFTGRLAMKIEQLDRNFKLKSLLKAFIFILPFLIIGSAFITFGFISQPVIQEYNQYTNYLNAL